MPSSTDFRVAKINKLSILGVRSFDNTRSETIQFHTPLSLIVGTNGSGKTTIIECLKYVTTGDLPPNSKGGAFIHDPKLCGEKEVLAQIRMSFRNTQGYSMVVTRNLQLTVKKNTRVQKTLEAQLLLIKDGERTSLSSRVADLDQAMPNYLGVSRAVLDNVIFCHQDESLWPMSEPGVLKKKFDEIFEALKYTKAIENIKKLRKDKNLEMGRLKEKELKEKYIKDQGDKAEKRSRVLDAEIAELKAQMTELDTKAKEAEVEWREASNHAARYESDVHSLENKLKQQGWLKNNVDKLGKNLKQRNESDEWLQSEIDNYEVRMAGHREHEKQQKHQYISIMCNIKAARETLREKHSDIGRYEQQKADHQQHMKQRKIMIKESSQRHNIRGYDTDLDDVQINEYMERISRLSKDRDAAVDKARREADREAKKTRDLLSKLGEQRSALNEGKNSAKQQSAVNDRRIGTFQSDLNNIGIDESEKAILEDKATDIEVRLKKANDESKKALLESKINDGESQLRGLDQEKHQLNQELNRVVDQAGELASLDNYKKELTERKRSLDKTSAVNGDRLQVVVGKAWKPSSLETDFKKILDRNTDQVRGAERQRDSVSRVLEQVDYKLSGAKTDLQKAEKEATICVQRLKENIDGEPEKYLETLTEIQHARDHYKAEFDNFVNERTYFIKALKGAEEKHQCNLCSRAFQGDEEPKFISKMRKRIDKDISDAERDRNDTEEELRKAKEAGPSHDTWVRLSKTEVPRLQDVLKKLVTEREKVIRDIEGHDKSVNDRVEARDDVQSLANIVAKITKYHQEITGLSAKVDEHTAKKEDAGMSRNMDEIRSEMDMLSAKSHDLQNSIAKLRIEKDRSQSLISDLKVDLSKATSHLLTANHQLDKKANLWKDIEDLRKLNRDHRDCVQRLDEQTQELAPQIAEEDAKLNDIEERGFEKVKGLRQEASRLSDSVNKLYLAEQNIAAYDNDGGLAKLQKCQREIENVQQEIGKAEEEQNLVTKSIKKIQEELLNHEGTKRTIQNNIQYRESLRELETIKTEIAKLSVENAEADLSHWQKQTKHWSRLHNQYSMDYTGKLGESKVKDNQLADLIIQWNTEYKDAAHNFKKAHIEVETTKAAVEDLGRYGGALDKAIMKYHGIKMEEVNRIIEELWKKTYQGTDVDTILIRSDNETATGNRSYNYRVCMIKQDAEMDMRGRCSAGQKVLASIIIRLALAECFGVNCGLVALDEPTTNLDRDNIRSLAGSLHDIIEARRHQSNFQLIVITHDEEFLKFMKCPDFCDSYYRVFRDNRQKSQIEKQSIAEVM